MNLKVQLFENEQRELQEARRYAEEARRIAEEAANMEKIERQRRVRIVFIIVMKLIRM